MSKGRPSLCSSRDSQAAKWDSERVASLKQQHPLWCYSTDSSNLRSNSPRNQGNLQCSHALWHQAKILTSPRTTGCYVVFMSCLAAFCSPSKNKYWADRGTVLCYENVMPPQRNSKLHLVGSDVPPMLSYTRGHGHHHFTRAYSQPLLQSLDKVAWTNRML